MTIGITDILYYSFLVGLTLIIVSLSLLYERRFRGSVVIPRPNPVFSPSITFFEDNANIIGIIGVIATIISLAPLFLTFILGDDWFNILLVTPLGVLALGAIETATFFAAIFIYCLLILIVVRWFNQVFLCDNVRFGEKLLSFFILLGGVIAIFCLVLFLLMVWFPRVNPVLSVAGLDILTFITALAALIGISLLVYVNNDIHSLPINIIFRVIIIFIFLLVIFSVVIPAITSGNSILKIASDYKSTEKYNFSFQPKKLPISNATPIIVSIQPNLSEYPSDDINLDYIDCLWSTNYGYFITINSTSLLTEKRSNEFIIPKCIEDPSNVYWTYDISDYQYIKPPVIVSLQVENSNKKSLYGKLGESEDYIVGNAYSNFTWINRNDLLLNDSNGSF